MPLSRRDFIRVSVGGTVITIGGLRSTSLAAASSAATGAAVGRPGTLVVLTLYGGNDAVNTVVPIGDPRYVELRGDLAVDPAATHDLGDGFALHPALAGCKQLWDDQRLAIVHGVGFGSLDRSHFHCMDVWQAASEDDHTSGWIGRWLDSVGDDPLAAVSVGNTLPLAMRGERRSAAVVPASGALELPGDDALRGALTMMVGDDAERSALEAAVAGSTSDLFAVVDHVGPFVGTGVVDDGYTGEGGAGTQSAGGSLAAQLELVADLVEAELPTRVYGVSLGGFDTHANQLGTHESLLGQLDTALVPFVERTAGLPVTVLVYTEFGRRIAPNGSAGTDHGGGGTVVLAGHVRAGHHGDPPSLDRLVDGDLATTTDFRAVYAGLIEGVLGVPAGDVLTDAPAALQLV